MFLGTLSLIEACVVFKSFKISISTCSDFVYITRMSQICCSSSWRVHEFLLKKSHMNVCLSLSEYVWACIWK